MKRLFNNGALGLRLRHLSVPVISISESVKKHNTAIIPLSIYGIERPAKPPGTCSGLCAGRLESRNIVEYETAARHAVGCGRADLVDCLLTMAEVEWEHEHYFRACVLRHRWAKRISIWPEPPPKDAIRRSFQSQT